MNGTTLVSDQSLLKLNFVITLGKNDIHMNLGEQQIDLSRTSNGIITFPIQSSKPVATSLSVLSEKIVTSLKPQCNNTPLLKSTLQSSDITTPNHGKIAPNHGTIAPSHEAIAPNHGKIDKHTQKSISLSELHLFHSKFGHISIDSTISILRSQNYIISESMRKSFFCKDCAMNKESSQTSAQFRG